MVEEKRSNRLDALNHQFEVERQGKKISNANISHDVGRRVRKQKLQSNKAKVSLTLLLFAFILVAIFSGVKYVHGNEAVEKNPHMEQYETVLTSTEKKDWKEKKNDRKQITLQLNTEVPVKADGKSAGIRLVNPPYNQYSCTFTLALKETPSKYLYSSEEILPGTVIETIDLNAEQSKKLIPGENKAVVTYTFYDRNEKEKGTYDVDITLMAE